jgi:tetratricopeptide (TPR) repeat protein
MRWNGLLSSIASEFGTLNHSSRKPKTFLRWRSNAVQHGAVGRTIFAWLVCMALLASLAMATSRAVAQSASTRRSVPQSSWDDSQSPSSTPSRPKRSNDANEPNQSADEPIAADLQAIYDRSQKANSVIEYNSVIEGCRNVMGDSTRLLSERAYAKQLLSWAANRRGELRSDMAGQMVQSQQLDEAEKLDRSAAEDFVLAIQNDPTRWRAHHNLGIAKALIGDTDGGIESFSTTIELNPKFVDAYHNRGELRGRQRQWPAAIDDFTKAIKLAPKDPGLHTARGNAQLAIGEIEAALADYQSAMTLDPESSQSATLFADTCQSLGRWKEAAEAYQKGMQIDPNNTRCLQNAAWMMATCPEEFYRDPATALKTVEKAVRTVQSSAGQNEPGPHLLHVLAVTQAANGDFATAVATLNEAILSASEPMLRRELAEHRALFQKKKPFIQTPAKDQP